MRAPPAVLEPVPPAAIATSVADQTPVVTVPTVTSAAAATRLASVSIAASIVDSVVASNASTLESVIVPEGLSTSTDTAPNASGLPAAIWSSVETLSTPLPTAAALIIRSVAL